MDTIYQGVLTLIRSAINTESLPLPEGFSLEAAAPLIRSQSLVPLLCRGAYQCGIDTTNPVLEKFQVQYFQHLVSSEKQMAAVRQIYAAFEENGIDYMPLKGCNLKQLYPRPEMRAMGDADILIRLEQYEKIKPIMQRLGYEPVKESSYDFCWSNQDLYVELHKRLFGPNETDLCTYFGTGWERARKGPSFRFDMSREDEYVYIFTHMAKHFRLCGIGVRHLVDLYMYSRAYSDLDEAQIRRTMKRLGLLEFYNNVCRAFQVWFEDRPCDPVTELITDYVFTSGSFGTVENKLYSQELIKAGKKKERANHARWKSLLGAIFPSLELMQLSYNILYKYPILYPFFWPVRWVDALLRRRGNVGRKLSIIRNMTDEKVESHQQALNRMGLSLDFSQMD